MRTGTRFIIIEVVSICLAVMVFLALCLRRTADPPFISEPHELATGETFNCEPYTSLKLTIKDIDAKGKNCLVIIRTPVDGKEQQGRINAGESISFAPDMPGAANVYIERIEKEKVSVVFIRGTGGYKYRLRLPWE